MYQESRTQKRERKQPGLIQTEEFLKWDRTGQAPGGLYGSLQIVELDTGSDKKQYDMIKKKASSNETSLRPIGEIPSPMKHANTESIDYYCFWVLFLEIFKNLVDFKVFLMKKRYFPSIYWIMRRKCGKSTKHCWLSWENMEIRHHRVEIRQIQRRRLASADTRRDLV